MSSLLVCLICAGDLKPGNILIRYESGLPYGRSAKVSDFGLSRYVLRTSSTSDIITEYSGRVVEKGPRKQNSKDMRESRSWVGPYAGVFVYAGRCKLVRVIDLLAQWAR